MKHLILTGKITAILSFFIGTILLCLFLYFKYNNMIQIGIYYVIIAFIINSILVITNGIAIIIDRKNRFEFIKTTGMMLLNIPIAIGYFYLVIHHIDHTF